MMTCDYGVEPDFVVHTQEEWSSLSSNIALTRRRRCPIVVIDSPAIYNIIIDGKSSLYEVHVVGETRLCSALNFTIHTLKDDAIIELADVGRIGKMCGRSRIFEMRYTTIMAMTDEAKVNDAFRSEVLVADRDIILNGGPSELFSRTMNTNFFKEIASYLGGEGENQVGF
jgi:hypothetical protein